MRSAASLLVASALAVLVACDDAPEPADAGGREDAGASSDAGPGATDAGGANDDAGSEGDAGPDVDAGPAADAGPAVDAGGPAPVGGIWISRDEVMALPMTGAAWEAVLADADAPGNTPNLSDQDQDHNVHTFARALVYARTGDESYRTLVREACMAAPETENGGRTLALGRELLAYVVAADLVGLEPDEDAAFRAWLDGVRREDLSGRTLISTHEDRPNNWGTHAGASRIAAAIYLGDEVELDAAARVFRGFVGDRAAHAGFSYGDLSWQCDASMPVGINPAGCTRDGNDLDGVIPDDQRRGGAYTWPAPQENYVWEALQGLVAQAHMLSRRGYDAWSWQADAIRRALRWLHEVNDYPAAGDDTWIPWLVNHHYGTSFPTSPSRPGKNIGYTDWTHAP